MRPPGPTALSKPSLVVVRYRARLLVAGPSSWPPCSSSWWCQWWRLRHRGATPSGAIDPGDAAWMILGRRSGDPEPADSRTVVVVVCGYRSLVAAFVTVASRRIDEMVSPTTRDETIHQERARSVNPSAASKVRSLTRHAAEAVPDHTDRGAPPRFRIADPIRSGSEWRGRYAREASKIQS
jgi:hypothetical protein